MKAMQFGGHRWPSCLGATIHSTGLYPIGVPEIYDHEFNYKIHPDDVCRLVFRPKTL